MSSSCHRTIIAVCVALVSAGVVGAGEPAKKDEAKLQEYQVGGNKNLPKGDTSVAKVERPKVQASAGFQLEKPAFEIAPMVVAPMAVSAAPAATEPAAKPAPKPAPVKPTAATPARAGAGTTAVLPSAALPKAPSPSGALPQVGGGGGSGEITLVPLSTPAPEYPREAAMAGITGFVVVAFTLNVEGVPQDISVLESSPPRVFDQSARRAVARWRFQPVVVDGRAVERKVQRRIDFN